jgi:hypothetical protein
MEAVTVDVKWYDETNIGELTWPDTEYGRYAKKYILPLMIGQSVSSYIHNVRTRLFVVTVDGIPLPVTVNDMEYDNSYVCSPYTHYVTYAGEELANLRNRPAEVVLGGVLNMIGLLLRKARFNRVVQVNNWLLSTNLYPALGPGRLEAVIDEMKQRYPLHAILCRSLNPATSGRCLDDVKRKGCKLIPSRQIYLLYGSQEQDSALDDAAHRPVNAKARWLVKRDRNLIRKQGYSISGPSDMQPDDVPRIKELYDMLYIHKYSACNPQFTEQFIRLAIESGTLELYGLRKHGRLDAVLGFFSREETMTAPLFGYDTTLPQKTGLYRMLSAVLIGIAEDRGLLLHESSGVGQFKRNRGAVAELEVTAVYDRHLPLMTRACWTILEKLLHGIGVPIIRKLKL